LGCRDAEVCEQGLQVDAEGFVVAVDRGPGDGFATLRGLRTPTAASALRIRLNVTRLRTMFGAKQRPHRDRAGGPPRHAAMIEIAPIIADLVFEASLADRERLLGCRLPR
jgi:hypothetical protein